MTTTRLLTLEEQRCNLKKEAKDGKSEAQYRLAMIYYQGEDVPKNVKRGIYYYELAAKQGHAHSLYELGCHYENHGQYEKALKYFDGAAYRNRLYSLYLSLRYQIGRCVPQDAEKAIFYHQLATTSDDAYLPKPLITQMSREKIFREANSLLLKITEKKDTEVSHSLADYALSQEIDHDKSYILVNPPHVNLQRGPACGLYALEAGLIASYPDRVVPPVRKNRLKPLESIAEEKNENTKMISLRRRAKEFGSVMGEVYDISTLEKIAKSFGFNECRAIKSDPENYLKTILTSIRTDHYVILPVDIKGGFPTKNQGLAAHYALAWGIIHKNNQDYLLVMHKGNHWLWSTDSFFESHLQLPDEIAAREFYKNRKTDTYPLKEENNDKIPETDVRKIPQTSLKKFQWSAVTLPVGNKNRLVVKNKNEEKFFYSGIDGLSLRFLFTMNVSVAKNKNDTEEDDFLLSLVKQIS